MQETEAFRVRLSPELSQASLVAWFFGKAAPGRVDAALAVLESVPALRFAASAHGRFDIAACLRLESIDDIPVVLESIAHEVPGVHFIDRSIVLQPTRRGAEPSA